MIQEFSDVTNSDYRRMAEAIEFIAAHQESQPRLDEIAAAVHLSPFHFQRLFTRWVGVTPKRFLQVLTLQRAKQLLGESAPLLEVTNSVGLSSGSRLYDHFVTLDAVTPGEYKSRGRGLVIDYGIDETPFGAGAIALTPRGVCRLAFLDGGDINDFLSELSAAWPSATLRKDQVRASQVLASIFADDRDSPEKVALHVTGTNFQISVWRALLDVPSGAITSYSRVAARLGSPKAARAVGSAVAANPVAFLIPCHRVIKESGHLGGYHWGTSRKLAINAWEAARAS